MAIAYRDSSTQSRTGGATPKDINLPAAVRAGDLILLQWTAGVDPDGDPSGWTRIFASPISSMSHIIWYKFAVAGDAGANVLVPSTGIGKVNINAVAYSGADSSTPIEAFTGIAETTSRTTHTSGTVSVADAAMVCQFLGMKDGATSSVTRSGPAGYALRQNATTGGAAYAIVGMAADRLGSAGTVDAVTWTADQPTSTASMVTVAVTPAQAALTANAGEPQADVEPWSTVTLTGTHTGGSDPVTHYWRQISGAPATLSATNAATVTFTAPGTLAGSSLVFGYRVTDDGFVDSPESTVQVDVLRSLEHAVIGGVEVPMRLLAVSSS